MKKIAQVAMLVFLVTSSLMLFGMRHASAASFNPNDIIDDGIFDNAESMSASQIDAFLNSLPNSCISTNSGFEAIDPTGYSPTTGYTYGGFVSAGQVIYDSAQAYDINPQVLLATLQKEQSLPAGGSGICSVGSSQNQYAAAVGYDCPDSGGTYSYTGVNLYERNGVIASSSGQTCVDKASAAGFSQQVIRAAWLLKFGEQRSQGNVGWAVIKAGWNNSDDPESCYDGPMTIGTFQICPNGTKTYYDGYTTIDGTSVDMTNGASAALYWYTPHLSGNESFFSIFTKWFGSTTYSQPLDAMFVVGNQSGKAYFISLDSNTYYFLPSWSTIQAFGLDRYQVMPMDDSQIDSYTNGGRLSTLVWNNDTQKIYLLDHGVKYWFQEYCSAWGLDCLNQTPGDVTFMTSTYFDDILGNGGNSQPLQQDNGSIYLMQNGRKEPFANTASLLAEGYNGSQILPINQTDLNSNQTLGPLQISTPAFVQFSTTQPMLYFDGTSYKSVPNYQVYEDWGLQSVLDPTSSSFNTTAPATTGALSDWVMDAEGDDYLVDSGRKISLGTASSNWFTGSYESISDKALTSLQTVSAKTNVNINGDIYVIQNGTMRHVPTFNDYTDLGINTGNTMNLSSGAYANIPMGVDVIGDGAFFTVTGNPGLYISDGTSSFHIPSESVANDFGVSWNGGIDMKLPASVLSSGYPSTKDISRWVITNTGTVLYVENQTQISIGTQAASNWGITTTAVNPTSVDAAVLERVPKTKALGQFVQDIITGKVYYGSGGAYHYVASYNTFTSLGGTPSNVLPVYPDFFAGLTAGTTLQ